MSRTLLAHIVAGGDVDIREGVEEQEDDADDCEGSFVVDGIVDSADDMRNLEACQVLDGGYTRRRWVDFSLSNCFLYRSCC